MSFKEMVHEDIKNVFLNTDEFAEIRTVEYDGVSYEDIPVVLTDEAEQGRQQNVSDHVQGLYLLTAVLYCALEDLGGIQPEKGRPIQINDEEGGGGFFQKFYVAASSCEMGMLRVELEAIDE